MRPDHRRDHRRARRGGGYNLPLKFCRPRWIDRHPPWRGRADLADYRFKGQLLAREDDGWIAGNLTVTYMRLG